jgi:putative exosortase-associated protein (TIGR04073 family)
MRSRLFLVAATVGAAFLAAGCAGPEKKLGRGLNNLGEFARGGEMRRSVEQTALWDGPTTAYTTGVIRGFNRSFVRTMVGLYEVVTFPFPKYDPWLKKGNVLMPDAPEDGGVVYPDNYTPRLLSDSTFETDTALGFSGGDIMPFSPGSRFRVFDY